MNKVAVLLTSFNRKKSTLQCLEQLFILKKDVDVYLVDDNSSDGTYESVAKLFPSVNLIKGTGNLFWCRGMHLAWEHAATKDYEYYLWLNDDVILYPNSFNELFDCVQVNDSKSIISGIIETANKDKTLYGGTDKNKKLILPNGRLNPITNMNGNVVLIPRFVFKTLGNFHPIYHHDLGDVDYGLRAQKMNIGVYSTRVPIASGVKNSICRERESNTNIINRFKKLYSPLGSNPNINYYFRKEHYGFSTAVAYFIFLLFINIIPDSINQLIFSNKYTSQKR